jgi:hypothetical protein
MSDKPGRDYKEWLRKKGWPFKKREPDREREREGAESIMPHVQEYLDQAKLLGRHEDEEKDIDKDKSADPDKPRH